MANLVSGFLVGATAFAVGAFFLYGIEFLYNLVARVFPGIDSWFERMGF